MRNRKVLDKGLAVELNLFENIACGPVQLISCSACALVANGVPFCIFIFLEEKNFANLPAITKTNKL